MGCVTGEERGGTRAVWRGSVWSTGQTRDTPALSQQNYEVTAIAIYKILKSTRYQSIHNFAVLIRHDIHLSIYH